MTEPHPRINPNETPLTKILIGIVINLLVWNEEYIPIASPNNPPIMNPIIAPLSILPFAVANPCFNFSIFFANFDDLSI